MAIFTRRQSSKKTVSSARVLVVTDEVLGSGTVDDATQWAGHSVAGIATDIDLAREALADGDFDAVLLAFRSMEPVVAEFAQLLKGQGIPFALIG
jgi:hypothetical protein